MKLSKEIITVKGISIEIYPSSFNTRKMNDNLTQVCLESQDFDFGTDWKYKETEFSSFEDLEETIKRDEKVLYIEPLFLQETSCRLRLITKKDPTYASSNPLVGFIFITQEGADITGVIPENFEQEALIELEECNYVGNGEVFGYTCCRDGEPVISGDGFLGRCPIKSGLLDSLEEDFKTLLDEVTHLDY